MRIELDEPEGFSRIHTGGGCNAWEIEYEGFDAWITDNDGVTVPCEDSSGVLVGFTLHDESLHFEPGNPPVIHQLFELAEPDSGFDVNGDYFSYYFRLNDVSVERIATILKSLSKDDLKYKVVVAPNTPEPKEMKQ